MKIFVHQHIEIYLFLYATVQWEDHAGGWAGRKRKTDCVDFRLDTCSILKVVFLTIGSSPVRRRLRNIVAEKYFVMGTMKDLGHQSDNISM